MLPLVLSLGQSPKNPFVSCCSSLSIPLNFSSFIPPVPLIPPVPRQEPVPSHTYATTPSLPRSPFSTLLTGSASSTLSLFLSVFPPFRCSIASLHLFAYPSSLLLPIPIFPSICTLATITLRREAETPWRNVKEPSIGGILRKEPHTFAISHRRCLQSRIYNLFIKSRDWHMFVNANNRQVSYLIARVNYKASFE